MVDWRLFENPFLDLEDIRLPVEHFERPDQALDALARMVISLKASLGVLPEQAIISSAVEPENWRRTERLRAGWERYTSLENTTGSKEANTFSKILSSYEHLALSTRHLEEWTVYNQLQEHGTAIFMLEAYHELAVCVAPDEYDPESADVRGRLRETLTAFTDPFARQRVDFDYEVLVQRGLKNTRMLSSSDVFGYDDFLGLEHSVEGEFDENGVFAGRVTAFGVDLGIQHYVPKRPLPKQRNEFLGRFKFCIGTVEQIPDKSTHTDQQIAVYKQLAGKFGGVTVYRDGLRVMPYGRTDADFFGIEEQRGKHAGRYFWAHRRSFGRVAFTRELNPNLRDKAGREGLVENRANRELRILVKGLLIDFAKRFFGTGSDIREDLLPEIQTRNKNAKAAAETARARRKDNLKVFLQQKRGQLDEALAEADELLSVARNEQLRKSESDEYASRYRILSALKEDLLPPFTPTQLGDQAEQLADYTRSYRELLQQLEILSEQAPEIISGTPDTDQTEVWSEALEGNLESLRTSTERFRRQIDAVTTSASKLWTTELRELGLKFEKSVAFIQDNIQSLGLVQALSRLEAERIQTESNLSSRFGPILSSLNQLIEGIDLDGALGIVDDERQQLQEKVRNLNALAQVGITVEIIGHELETLESEVRRNLLKLSQEVGQTRAFYLAFEAQKALTDRLRFLSPLKIAGYRARQTISGESIEKYVLDFFETILRSQQISLSASESFRRIKLTDLPSRIFPVFINLINNSIYWLAHCKDKRIILGFQDALVIVADSGPGVDDLDQSQLFNLFFSRRESGRGLGLYLSRENLAVGRHTIRYARGDDPKLLPGANFIIQFRGITG